MKTLILSIASLSLVSCSNLTEVQNDRVIDLGSTLGIKVAEYILTNGQASSIEATK